MSVTPPVKNSISQPLLALIAIVPLMIAADRPEIVRVRAPASSLPRFFPEGTEVRAMPIAEFEALVTAVPTPTPVAEDLPPLRIEHRIRWQDGVLTGRTTIRHRLDLAAGGATILSPWSPAIRTTPDSPHNVAARLDGTVVARSSSGSSDAITIAWEQMPRAGSEGLVFDLELPAADACRYVIELPGGFEPEIAGTIRQEPTVDPRKSERSWTFDGPGGVATLRLRPTSPPRGRGASPAWVSGLTRVDATESPARWDTSWRVEPSEIGLTSLTAELSHSLDLVDVTGPRVASFSTTRSPGGALIVTVRFDGPIQEPTSLNFQALARVDLEGAWGVPAMAPRDALWTGGRTLVRFGPKWDVNRCDARAAQRVAARPAERQDWSTDAVIFAFEATAPTSVADFFLTSSQPRAWVEVLGEISLGSDAPRMVAELTWNLERGRSQILSADLPPGWMPESVRVRGSKTPNAWHAEARPGGGSRLHVLVASPDDPTPKLVLELAAVLNLGTSLGPLDVPRITPIGVRTTEEIWSIRARPDLDVVPQKARGLAWLDPATLAEINIVRSPNDPTRTMLAWRWTSADGRATVLRTSATPHHSLEAWTLATLDRDLLTLDYAITLDAESGSPMVGFRGPSPPSLIWKIAAEPVREVVAAPLDDAAKRVGEIPAEASAWTLKLPQGLAGRTTLVARATVPWTGSGSIPCLVMADRRVARGGVLVLANADQRLSSTARNIDERDADLAKRFFREAYPALNDPWPPSTNSAIAFGPAGFGASLQVMSERLPPAGDRGMISEASLVSRGGDAREVFHQLRLQVVVETARDLGVTLPADASLDRVRVDDRGVSPVHRDRNLEITLPQGSGRHEVEIAYRTPVRPWQIQAERPTFSLPCLGFRWSVRVPSDREIRPVAAPLIAIGEQSPGSHAENLIPKRRQPLALSSEEQFLKRGEGSRSLSEFLDKLDTPEMPLIIDREALTTAGLGPKTSLAGNVDSILATTGLVLSKWGNAVRVTTASRIRSEISPPEAEIPGILTTGSDGMDRHQTLFRWLGEPTPRTAENHPIDVASYQFAATFWPDRGARVELIPLASRWRWETASGLLLLLALMLVRQRRGGWRSGSLAVLGSLVAATGGLIDPSGRAAQVGLVTIGVLLIVTAVFGSKRWGSLVAAAGLALVASHFHEHPSIAGATASDPPILAVIPFTPPFDPAQSGETVYLRVDDLRRLIAAGQGSPVPQLVRGPEVEESEHRVTLLDRRTANFRSVFVLRSSGPSTWTFPIENCRRIAAELDGQPATVEVLQGGREGSIRIPGNGQHRLILSRESAVEDRSGEQQLRLSIPSVPTASLEVLDPDLRSNPAVQGSRGPSIREKARLTSLIGPTRTILIRWRDDDRPDQAIAPTVVDARSLWDVAPSGDHVRTRFVLKSARPIEHLGLQVAAQLDLHKITRGSGRHATLHRFEDGEQVTIDFEPGLAEGETVEIEGFRPLATASDGIRTLPELLPRDVITGDRVIAARRAEDGVNSGRLVPEEGQEIVADDAFTAAWGALPRDETTFAGAVRSPASIPVHLRTLPTESRPVVHPRVLVDLSPGRIQMRADATWTETATPRRELVVTLPRDLRVIHVEAEGLSHWSRGREDRLSLWFTDARFSAPRHVRVDGWVPIDGDPLETAVERGEIRIPWPSWGEMEPDIGDLQVQAARGVTFELASGSGVAPTSEKGVFRVPPQVQPGRLMWTIEPSRVNVAVQSRLTIHPRTIDWAASARYRVSRGLCPRVQLRVPGDWGEHARAEIVGVRSRFQADSTPSGVVWTLTPDHPIWGTLQVVVHGSRAISEAGPIEFPDIVPLSRKDDDRVETLVAVADASGRTLRGEPSTGLQPVETSRWDAQELSLPVGANRQVFRVAQDGWRFRFLTGDSLAPPAESGDQPDIRLADCEGVVGADGAMVGRAKFHLDNRAAAWFAIELPGLALPIVAEVDHTFVPVRRDHRGLVLIPLPRRSQSLVQLVWTIAPGNHAANLTTLFPRLASPDIPCLFTIYDQIPPRYTSSLPETTSLPLEVARLEVMAEELPGVNDPSKLPTQRMEALRRFERLLERVQRIGSIDQVSTKQGLSEATPALLQRIQRIRERVKSSLDPGVSAASVGTDNQENKGFNPVTVGTTVSSTDLEDNLRIRRLGTPRFYRGPP